MKNALLVLAGITALALGILGIALPVLPTTPFLLLALYCFAKGSERLDKWFRATALYRKYLVQYVRAESLTLRQRLMIQVSAGAVMAVSFVLTNRLVIRVVLVLGFIIHNYVFMFVIKTRKSESDCTAHYNERPTTRKYLGLAKEERNGRV